ncbi:MAG: spermidine/putrescine transport system permease protein [Actinomycetota bacterium]|jgi:spermidine/putrescine transport system permease protein|nr:spermidine/putrescine transport system permease protein [Actinomycetota bacterium]
MGGRGRTQRSAVAEPRLLLLPAWGWFVVFFFIPLGYMVVYSFGINTGFFTVQFGLHTDQYARLWDPIYLNIYKNTFFLAATGTAGCLLIGYPFAYFLATRAGKHRNLLFFLVIVPFWTSLLIRTYSWILILNEKGPLSELLQRLHVISKPLDILYTNSAVLIGVVYDYLPLMIFPLYVAIERMDRSLIEASRDLGAGRLRTFRKVTIPLTLPGIMTGCLLTFIPMMGEYVVPTILGGAKSFLVGSLVANEILTAIDWPFGAAVSMGLVIVLLIAITLYLKVVGGKAEENLGAAL